MKNLEASQFAEYKAAQKNLDNVCRAINLKARRIIKELKPEEGLYSELVGQNGVLTDAGWAFINSFPYSQKMNRLIGQRDELRSFITDMEECVNILESDISLWEEGDYRFLTPKDYDMFLFVLKGLVQLNGVAPRSFSLAVSKRLGRPVDGMFHTCRDICKNRDRFSRLATSRTVVCSVDSDVPEMEGTFSESEWSEIISLVASSRWVINDARDEVSYEVIPYKLGFLVIFSRKGSLPLFMELDKDCRAWSFQDSFLVWSLFGHDEAILEESETENFTCVAEKAVRRLFSIFDMYRKGDQVEYVNGQFGTIACSGSHRKIGGNTVRRIHVVNRIVERNSVMRFTVGGTEASGSTERVFVLEGWYRREHVRTSRNGKKVTIPAVMCHRRQDLLSEGAKRRQEPTVKRVRLME